MDRRTVMKAVGGTALAVALAGCSDLLQEEDDPIEDAEVPDEPIEAGLQTLEGAPAVLGVQAQYGAETAVRRINDNGGIADRQVELEVVEEGEEALENYQQFVDDGMDVTFGPISSGNHEAMVPEINDQGDQRRDRRDGDDAVRGGPPARGQPVLVPVPEPRRDGGAGRSDRGGRTTRRRRDRYVRGDQPGYAFGFDEQEIFAAGIEQLTGAELVYEGFPDLDRRHVDTHRGGQQRGAGRVVLELLGWRRDAPARTGHGAGMFDNVELLVGPVLYGSANDLSEDLTDGPIRAGSRNFYWDQPDTERWSPGDELVAEVQDEYGVLPTAHFMSGYGAVTAWATAAEKAVRLLGRWPDQEELAEVLTNHGFFTPAGYHTIGPDHQGYSNAHFGELAWSGEYDAAVIEDVNVYAAKNVSPPQGQTSLDWIESW